jgi:hypothetical protein
MYSGVPTKEPFRANSKREKRNQAEMEGNHIPTAPSSREMSLDVPKSVKRM